MKVIGHMHSWRMDGFGEQSFTHCWPSIAPFDSNAAMDGLFESG